MGFLSIFAALPIISTIIKAITAFVNAIISCKPCMIAIAAIGAALFIYHAGWAARDVDYQKVRTEVAALEHHFECNIRPAAERELSVCITSRERDAAAAVAAELQRQRDAAAQAQADLDRTTADLDAKTKEFEDYIFQQSKLGDGSLPQVMLDAWARRRALMGVK